VPDPNLTTAWDDPTVRAYVLEAGSGEDRGRPAAVARLRALFPDLTNEARDDLLARLTWPT